MKSIKTNILTNSKNAQIDLYYSPKAYNSNFYVQYGLWHMELVVDLLTDHFKDKIYNQLYYYK